MSTIVKTSHWHYGAEVWLIAACNAHMCIYDVRMAVIENRATLFDIEKDGHHCGSFVVAVDGKDIVVLAAGGNMPGDNAYKVMTKFVEALAIKHGCDYIRGHTLQPAVGRMMQAAGFSEPVEMIYRKRVEHGRRH